MQSLAQRLVSDWIIHDGGKCPCVGEWVEVYYDDNSGRYRHEGVAQDGIFWRYVTHYRLIDDPADVV